MTTDDGNKKSSSFATVSIPQINLPKSGGAIRSMDEKFNVNAANGTSGSTIGFPFSASRNNFMPGLALNYNSGSGNSIFGMGWNAEPAAIVRRTDKKLPLYNNGTESDIFSFSGNEDLVPYLIKDSQGNWVNESSTANGVTVTRYRPRLEGDFSRIEKIKEADGIVFWKVTSGSNIVSIFGKSSTARIEDPEDPTRIFKWLLEFSYDDKGNCYQYEYKPEDKTNVTQHPYEKNRLNNYSAVSNIYLKRIKYGNKIHFKSAGIDLDNWNTFLSNINYLLEMVFDYGEHDAANPQPADDNGWICRSDPFSDYRAGFEIRTYRVCNRVLMFHHFAELGAQPCLVNSLDFTYAAGPAFTFLSAATKKGYIRKNDGTYSQKSLPPLEFTYENLGWDTTIRSLPLDSVENLPIGIDDTIYQWIDLYNEGIAGILTEQAGAWYYKSNSGGGNLDPLTTVISKPSLSGLATGELHFQDIEANGKKALVSNDLHGYYELSDDSEWQEFKNFGQITNIDIRDPNIKFLDLDGDGRPDILFSEDELFVWYASAGVQGYENSKTTRKAFDEEKGPNMVFADSTQSIVMADMSGDGMTDIVRIRYSEVVYWPNLGYGKFGAKVIMGNTPVFDTPENFNPRYVKLADLDGSGTTDIVYLGQNSFQVYFNQAGNSWSSQNIVNGVNPLPFPQVTEYNNISVTDLLGNGTACITWSSPLPQYTGTQLFYIDLMGGKKPHIMISSKNNMGLQTNISYKPSTYFYLQDKKAGTPWITRLPFPVQCVSEVEVIDHIAKTRFTNQYTYHHGYYDHDEREFRGFGRVDQTDTEDFDNYQKKADPSGRVQIVDIGFHQPPVLTKTWFHTGAFLSNKKILNQFSHEYYQNNVLPELQPADPPLPADLSVAEYREALRTCKSMPLRIEVYTPDGSSKQNIPYTTSNHSCLIKLQQPRQQNPYAVFTVQQSEALTYTYERDPSDPRIAHAITLETDMYGNVLKSATINYGRKTADTDLTAAEQAQQGKTYIIFSQNNVTNNIDNADAYRLPLPYEAMTWELTGLKPAAGDYFNAGEINIAIAQAATIPFETLPTAGKVQKRMLSHAISLFLKDDSSGPLNAGIIEPLALPYQTYKLALTPTLRNSIFGTKINNALLINEGKYTHFNDANYWIASGTQTMDAAYFYQVTALTDPFGISSKIIYDSTYRFFVQQTIDAAGNTNSIAGFNYRTLSPYLIQDINDNRSGIRADELGMVTASFMMGKAAETKGDLMDTATIEASANDRPGVSVAYDLDVYHTTGQPNFIKTTVQEKHFHDVPVNGQPSPTQISYAYASGNGSTIMQKKQAEPGLALQENPDGTVTEIDTTPNLRWIGNGRTILNNKGKPVKQYEPYFSVSPNFEDSSLLVERGVTPVISYDSAGRVIRTDMPDGTFSKVEFDSWKHLVYDQNDTVLQSQWYADRITHPVPEVATAEEIAAAKKAALHANTPAISYLDSLGRSFIAIANNGVQGKYKTITQTDITGSWAKITNARGNMVQQHRTDMIGTIIYSANTEAGERWNIPDVMGKPLRGFDSRENIFRYSYDALHRPLKVFLQTGNTPEITIEKTTYGEETGKDKINNLRGKIHQHFDTVGLSTNTLFDFKGNTLQSQRQLCVDYKNNIDWNTNPQLNATVFKSSSAFDALNRPISLTTPDQSVHLPVYNEAGALNSIDVRLKGASVKTNFIKDINYNVKGQKESIIYGNNTKINYRYNPKTYRLSQILTTGKNGTDLLQKLSYTYDPVGNITTIKDEAQQTVYFSNSVVDPSNDYTYDATYQLIAATGREHTGQNLPSSSNDNSRINKPQPGDGSALRNYTQNYQYDAAGNILQMIHSAGAGSWTRLYEYDAASNRLINNKINNVTEAFTYDAHGNIQDLTQLNGITWNFKDQLQQADLGGGGKAYYVYDSTGQRVRKVIERLDGTKTERIYLGGFEIYRENNSAGITQEETETLHAGEVALIETKTLKAGKPVAEQLIRYQYGNHLGSAALELDNNGAIISYEEYYPYGSTSYQAVNATIKAAAKRYRYTNMERDDETGLEYHSARYYLPWLGRWLNADPIGIKGGMNVYEYAYCNPIKFNDNTGNSPKDEIYLFNIARAIESYHFNKGAGNKEVGQQGLIGSFLSEGRKAWGAYAKDMDSVELFDLGVAIYASKHNIAPEDLRKFSHAAEDGNYRRDGVSAEERLAKDSDLYTGKGTMTYSIHPGAVLEDKQEYPSLGTHANIELYQQNKANAGRIAPMLTFNLLNSMGGGVESGHTEGRGIGPQPESAHGASLDPLISGKSSDTKSAEVVPRPPILPEVENTGTQKKSASKTKSKLRIPSIPENPTVKTAIDGINETEVKSGYNVHNTEAVDQWELFLGKDYTNVNPFTGQQEASRLFSKDGTRSVRYSEHEMDHGHYHLEFWGMNAETGETYRVNIYQDVNNQYRRNK